MRVEKWDILMYKLLQEKKDKELKASKAKGSKPDFLDLDKDGDKSEPMSKAAKEAGDKKEAPKSKKSKGKIPPQLKMHIKKKKSKLDEQIEKLERILLKENPLLLLAEPIILAALEEAGIVVAELGAVEATALMEEITAQGIKKWGEQKIKDWAKKKAIEYAKEKITGGEDKEDKEDKEEKPEDKEEKPEDQEPESDEQEKKPRKRKSTSSKSGKSKKASLGSGPYDPGIGSYAYYEPSKSKEGYFDWLGKQLTLEEEISRLEKLLFEELSDAINADVDPLKEYGEDRYPDMAEEDDDDDFEDEDFEYDFEDDEGDEEYGDESMESEEMSDMDSDGFDDMMEEVEYLSEAEVKKKKPRLGKVTRNPSGSKKKFHVYVKCGGRVKKISFGDPGLSIKRDSAARRKNFRARHKCDKPAGKDRCTARYWSCYQWRAGKKVEGE